MSHQGTQSSSGSGSGSSPVGRPYLRIYFKCANQYVRVYRRPEDPEYIARCPTCGLSKRFRVGSGGTGKRFFELSCR